MRGEAGFEVIYLICNTGRKRDQEVMRAALGDLQPVTRCFAKEGQGIVDRYVAGVDEVYKRRLYAVAVVGLVDGHIGKGHRYGQIASVADAICSHILGCLGGDEELCDASGLGLSYRMDAAATDWAGFEAVKRDGLIRLKASPPVADMAYLAADAAPCLYPGVVYRLYVRA
jgi:hypothetical protein